MSHLKLVHGASEITLCVAARRALAREVRALRAHSAAIVALARYSLQIGQDESDRAFFTREIADSVTDFRERLDALERTITRGGVCHSDP